MAQNNFFIETLFSPTKGDPITVYFKNGQSADYTSQIMDLLKSDKSVLYITDATTGEIIFENN